MEARQRVKLSLTNRSIGLISSFADRQIATLSLSAVRSSKPALRTHQSRHKAFLA